MSFGLNFGAQYKGFDLSASLQGVGKRDILLQGDMVWPLWNAGKIQKWHLDECWSAENTDARYPAIKATSAGSNDAQMSSTWVFNAAYLRLRNITIGYTLPSEWLTNFFIKGVRIYCSGLNLLTFDKLPAGIDPLVPNGSNGGIFPVTSNFSVGIDVNFK